MSTLHIASINAQKRKSMLIEEKIINLGVHRASISHSNEEKVSVSSHDERKQLSHRSDKLIRKISLPKSELEKSPPKLPSQTFSYQFAKNNPQSEFYRSSPLDHIDSSNRINKILKQNAANLSINKGKIDSNFMGSENANADSRLEANIKVNIPKLKANNMKQKALCCCCWRNTQRETKRIIKPKVKERWMQFLRKVLLAGRVITALKELKEEREKRGGLKKDVHRDVISTMARLSFRKRGSFGPGSPKVDLSKECVILPDSNGMWIWVICIIILICWSVLYIPYRLAFIDHISIYLWIIEFLVDFIFMVDIVVNFFIAYYNKDAVLVTNNCSIAKRYLRTWFLLDLVSCIPLQLFELTSQDEGNIDKIPRIYKMIKVLRIAKIMNIQKPPKLFEKIFFFIRLNAGLARLCKVLITMMVFIHFYSCLWYLIAKIKGYPPDCWVMRLSILDENNITKYLISFSWVLQTLTTVGYGDMPLSNNSERILAIILMIGGVGFYSYTIGNLSSIFSDIDSKQAKFNAKIISLNEYANQIKMPPNLYFKILRIMEKNSKKSYVSDFDQESLLRELPTALRTEIQSVTQKKILESFFFLKDKPPHFVKDVLKYLKHIALSPDEVIYRKGDPAEERFITDDGYIYRNYAKGSYFGDLEIFKENRPFRKHAALTMEETEFLMIKKDDLLRILSEYPSIYEEMKDMALNRFKSNQTALKVAILANFKVDDEISRLVKGDSNANLYKNFFAGQGSSTSFYPDESQPVSEESIRIETEPQFHKSTNQDLGFDSLDEDNLTIPQAPTTRKLSFKKQNLSEIYEVDSVDESPCKKEKSKLEASSFHFQNETHRTKLGQIFSEGNNNNLSINETNSIMSDYEIAPILTDGAPSVEEGKRVEGKMLSSSDKYDFTQVVHSKPNFLSQKAFDNIQSPTTVTKEKATDTELFLTTPQNLPCSPMISRDTNNRRKSRRKKSLSSQLTLGPVDNSSSSKIYNVIPSLSNILSINNPMQLKKIKFSESRNISDTISPLTPQFPYENLREGSVGSSDKFKSLDLGIINRMTTEFADPLRSRRSIVDTGNPNDYLGSASSSLFNMIKIRPLRMQQNLESKLDDVQVNLQKLIQANGCAIGQVSALAEKVTNMEKRTQQNTKYIKGKSNRSIAKIT